VLAAIPLIAEVRKNTPRTQIFVSTSTLAGRETADKRLSGLANGLFFAPFDFVWCVRRVLRHLRPTVVVVLETEIWPNLFCESKRIGCGLIIVNGRISDRAFPRYQRYAAWFAPVLGLCDRILVQSAEMKQRFEAAGAPAAVVEVGGNLKYDFAPSSVMALKFIEADLDRPLWIAASTSADEQLAEEDFVIAAQRQLPGWRLIIAPRKPERFESVARLLDESGLSWARRSVPGAGLHDILLLDSIGELSGLFPYATVVFMGGTLADKGGHNILEPAIFGKPVVAGPHMENFREIAEHFERHHAMVRIDSGEDLAAAVLAAASDPALGERARAAAAAKRGAALRAADAIVRLYESCYPRERHPQPAQALLWLLSRLWKEGSKRDRDSKRKRAASLPVPVVSVGNLTTGGTGKTPVTIELLRGFRADGAGLLMRGYGRMVRENIVILDDHHAPVSSTGDEAQLCMRATGVPIGIGADRRAAGLQLLNAAHPRLLFLDDGFQHLQLERDFDLVLIDALHPFGGGELVPLGRLREPLEGLARASAFVITRADEAPNTKAIEAALRKYNATAPIFFARTVACKWREADGSEFDIDLFAELAEEDMRAIAFCGLGNPNAFWRTLRQVGIDPVASYDFEDHHQYTPAEIRRLARHARDIGAGSLLTTAKDAVNLAPEYPEIIGSLKLYWLEVRTEIENEQKLVALIKQSVL